MNKQLREKVLVMLKSKDPEMINLGVALFCEHTKDYADYWYIRTEFDNKAIFLQDPWYNAFKTMYKVIDGATINPYLISIGQKPIAFGL